MAWPAMAALEETRSGRPGFADELDGRREQAESAGFSFPVSVPKCADHASL